MNLLTQQSTSSSSVLCASVTYTGVQVMDNGEWIMNNYQFSIVTYQLRAAKYQVVIAAGSHLFPFRTEKLSPPAPMVLQCNVGE